MTLADSLRRLNLTAPDAPSDGELVGRYARARDEGAFAELLRRHGAMVYGVCRRVLRNGPDADDAFQAVFLVLARKAGTLGEAGLVGNWLVLEAPFVGELQRRVVRHEGMVARVRASSRRPVPVSHATGSEIGSTRALAQRRSTADC